MNPQLDKTPAMPFVSQPTAEQGASGFDGQYGAYRSPEAASTATELPPIAPIMAAPAAPAPMPMPTAAIPIPDPTAIMPPMAVPADDSASDELDKEWITKAKAIVDMTRNDPFLQSREMGKVKADYLRVKYNKNIKVAEDKAQ